jgi:hypothetical protein
VVLGGTDVPLPNSQVLSGVTVDGTNTTFTVPGTAAYQVSYCVRTTSALLMSTRLVVNGSSATQTDISPGTAMNTFCRGAIMNLSAGDQIRLQLYGLLGAAILLNPGGAELQIVRLN